MTAPSTTEPGPAALVDAACYVYGIVAAGSSLPDDLRGVGGVPARLVGAGTLAAVVSDLSPDVELGTPDNLMAHGAVVDKVAVEIPLLPLRFGTVVDDESMLVTEVLEPEQERLGDALDELGDGVQYSLRGKYTDDVLREVVNEEPEIARLRQLVRDQPEDRTYSERLRLGEMVVAALAGKRERDAATVEEEIGPQVRALAFRESGSEEAFDLAVLVPRGAQQPFESAVDRLGERVHERIRIRLVGPQAAYDFTPQD